MSKTTVLAVIMAGGKGSRLERLGEKPLVKIGGLAMFKRVLFALRTASRISDIVIATSRHTPNTAKEASVAGLRVIETPGGGYVDDLEFLEIEFATNILLLINADLPFITNKIIDNALDRYRQSGRPALTVMVSTMEIMKLGFNPTYNINGLSPIGLNIVDPQAVKQNQEEESILVIDAIFGVNINTPSDAQLADRLPAIIQHPQSEAEDECDLMEKSRK